VPDAVGQRQAGRPADHNTDHGAPRVAASDPGADSTGQRQRDEHRHEGNWDPVPTENSAGATAIRPFAIPVTAEAEIEALRARIVATRWLPLYLNQLGMARPWMGDFAGTASLVAESDSVVAAIGSPSAPYTLLRLRALQGREAEASALIASAIEQAAAGGDDPALRHRLRGRHRGPLPGAAQRRGGRARAAGHRRDGAHAQRRGPAHADRTGGLHRDTHLDTHTAAICGVRGRAVSPLQVPATAAGYAQLPASARLRPARPYRPPAAFDVAMRVLTCRLRYVLVRAMVFNRRGWSRSSYTCHSACEVLTADAVAIPSRTLHRQAVAPIQVARTCVLKIVSSGEGTCLRAP
jgi:hypothetical protein